MSAKKSEVMLKWTTKMALKTRSAMMFAGRYEMTFENGFKKMGGKTSERTFMAGPIRKMIKTRMVKTRETKFETKFATTDGTLLGLRAKRIFKRMIKVMPKKKLTVAGTKGTSGRVTADGWDLPTRSYLTPQYHRTPNHSNQTNTRMGISHQEGTNPNGQEYGHKLQTMI